MAYNEATLFMVRRISIFSMTFAVLFAFFSCNKEGVYNPKKKIAKIEYTESNGRVHFETWKWNKKQLESITEDKFVINFEYDKKSRIEKATFLGGSVSYIYTGNELTKMDSYDNDFLSATYEFEHTKSQITKITVTIHSQVKASSQMQAALSLVLPQTTCNNVEQFLQKTAEEKQQKAGEPFVYAIELTWDGKNVVKEVYPDKTIDYTYDENNNPFYDSFKDVVNSNLSGLSQNNVVVSKTYQKNEYVITNTYTYSYDKKKYPMEVKCKSVEAYKGIEDGSATILNTSKKYEYVE